MDRCNGHDDCRSALGSQCQNHRQHQLPGCHGTFAFWRKSHLSANHSAGNAKKYPDLGKKYICSPRKPELSLKMRLIPNSEIITGISSINSIALLSLEGSGMIGIPGFSKRLFEALASEKVNVILITQSSSEHSICVAVNIADAQKAKEAVDRAFETEIANGRVEALKVETELVRHCCGGR